MTRDMLEEFTKEELSGPKIDRRTSIKLLSVAGLATLAGCSGSGGSNGSGSGSGSSNGNGSGSGSGSGSSNGNGSGSGSGSSNGNGSGSGSGSSNRGGKLIAGWNLGAFSNLDPQRATDSKMLSFIKNIHRTPLKVKEDFTFSGDLAKDWEVGSDPFSVTLMLREDVTYHNGQKMIADHMASTVRRAINEDTTASADIATLRPPDEGGIEVEDDYRIRFEFTDPFAPAFSKMAGSRGRAFMPYPPDAIENKQQFNLEPVGTGPFAIVNHTQGEVLNLEAHDAYYGTDANGTQLPYLDELEIRFVPEPSQLLNAIRGESIHVINQVPYANIDQAKGFNGVDVVTNPGTGYESAVPKIQSPEKEKNEPFSNRKFRQGLAKLIDREEYIQEAVSGYGAPTVGPVHQSLDWLYREETGDDGFGGELKHPAQNYAPEEGKKIIKNQAETPFSFAVTIPKSDLRAGKVLVRQWNENSDGLLKVTLNQVTDAQWGDVLTTGDWDMSMAGAGNVVDPDALVYNFFRWDHEFGPKEEGYDGVWNEGHYMNDKVHKLIGEQRRTPDREQRKKILWEMEDRLIYDVARIWVYNPDDVLAKRSYVSDIGTTANAREFWKTTINN